MKKNIIANFIGKIWGLLSNFLFIPIYINLLGFNSYSIISYTLVIAGVLIVLDSGLTATLLREFSRQDHNKTEKIKVYETLQIIYLGVISLAILGILVFSNVLSRSLKVDQYSNEQVSFFLKIVSIDLAFQLMFRFYLGGLMGLEKQVKANIIQVLWGVFRSAFAVLVIYIVPSLDYFFIWQSIVTVIFTIIVKFYLDAEFYNRKQIQLNLKFDKNSFSAIKSFAGGMLLFSLLSVIASQSDKIMISNMLDLENLGYYTLGVSLSSVLIAVVNPISAAVLPKITEFFSLFELEKVKEIFIRYNLVISIIVFSVWANLGFFSKELIEIWTKNRELAEKSYSYVPFVAGAYSFIVLQTMCYQVALGKGYTKLNNVMLIVNSILIIPGYYITCKLWGTLGISIFFFISQVLFYFIYTFLINKKFLNINYFKNIFINQFIFPAIIAFIVTFIFFQINKLLHLNHFFELIFIGISVLVCLFFSGVVLSSGEFKKELIGKFLGKVKM